jgi:hypothetical protein
MRCTTLCDKVCQRLVTGQWFSPGTPVSSTNKTDHDDLTLQKGQAIIHKKIHRKQKFELPDPH